MALSSGAGSAWLYEVLDVTLRGETFTTVRGKGIAIERWSAAATMILGAALYGVDPRLPFIAAGALMLGDGGGGVLLLTLPRTAGFEAERSGPAMRDGLPVVGEKLARPSLRSFVVLVALVFGVVGAANGYTKPVAIAVVQNLTLTWLPVFGNEGLATSLGADLPVSAATGVGPLYASFAAVGAVVSYYAGRIESRLGLRRSLVGLATVLVVTLAALLLVPVIALGTVYLLKSVQHLLRPMVGRYVNDRVEDVCRATVLSAVSMVFGIARTPFVILAGIAAGAAGPVTAFPALAGLFLLAVLPLVLVGSPLPAATEQRLGTRPRQ